MSNNYCANCPICGQHWHRAFFDLWHASVFMRGHLVFAHGFEPNVKAEYKEEQ